MTKFIIKKVTTQSFSLIMIFFPTYISQTILN